MGNPLQAYAATKTDTSIQEASPHKLIALLFERMSSAVALARGHHARGDFEAKSKEINKLIDIVSYLAQIIDSGQASEVVESLKVAYSAVVARALEAGASGLDEHYDDVQKAVANLSSAWAAADGAVE